MVDVAIVGYGQVPSVRSAQITETQMVLDVTQQALGAAGVDRHDIGFTVSGSCDYLAGQAFAFVQTIEAIGAWPPISESHVEMDGAWAMYEGWTRLQEGDIDSVLVYSHGRSSPGKPWQIWPLQLDPYHLPFVHRTTIGRGMAPAMKVWTDVGDERVRTGMTHEDGETPAFYVEFRWANLWENHISPKFSIVAAFAPIDACRTRTYLRNYQRMVMVPGIGWLFDVALLWSNRKIFAQDEQVVVSQPQHPLIPEGDVMVKADAAIIAYRKMLARNLRPAMRSAAECV